MFRICSPVEQGHTAMYATHSKLQWQQRTATSARNVRSRSFMALFVLCRMRICALGSSVLSATSFATVAVDASAVPGVGAVSGRARFAGDVAWAAGACTGLVGDT